MFMFAHLYHVAHAPAVIHADVELGVIFPVDQPVRILEKRRHVPAGDPSGFDLLHELGDLRNGGFTILRVHEIPPASLGITIYTSD